METKRMKSRFKLLILALAPVALMLGSTSARANVYSLHVTNGGSGNNALDATATFTTSAGQIVVTLTNNLGTGINNLSAAETISDISFTLGTTSGPYNYTATGSSVTGQLATINGAGLVTYTSGDPLRWLGQGPSGGQGTVPSITGNVVTVEALGNGAPTQLITPNFANGTTYGNTNSSLTGLGTIVVGSESITLKISGITSLTSVTSATVSFGTGPDTFLTGTPQVVPGVPEPSTSFLVLAALAPLGVVELIRRRRRRTTDPA
jgi:hypothetical protein